MSLKRYFSNKKSNTSPTSNLSIEDIGAEVESFELVETYIKLSKKASDDIDWLEPAQFARYGLAEKYYEDAIKNIYKTYPYDGSFKEKLEWELSSSQLSTYMLDNYYPRSNGFVNIGYEYGTTGSNVDNYAEPSTIEYIHFYGTLNTSEKAKNAQGHFEYSNKLDHSTNRTFNLNLNGHSGSTVEFYFKKDNYSGSNKQVILDIWNSSSAASDDYGRYIIETHPGIAGEEQKFYIHLRSGSSGVDSFSLGSNLDFTGSWHHYAITSVNSSSNLVFQLYVDGVKLDEVVTGSTIGQVGGNMEGQLGSLITSASGSSGTDRGWGKLSGSLDEFRYWKTKRTDKDIKRNYFLPIGAGTNTDDSNTDLGIYYKFNEGIYDTTTISSFDKNVLDYSGRISNGTWNGYSLGSRNSGSAIVLSENYESEFADPILYSSHPEILEVLNYFINVGIEYDRTNQTSLFNTVPQWIAMEDVENGEGLKDLLQIMSELIDDIYIKIEKIPEIKNVFNNDQELYFVKKVLENIGFKTFDVLSDTTLLEEFLTRNEDSIYEEKLFKIKNEIYRNLYNNLIYLYRSKGTSKSFRNLIRCFGVDENLIQLNLYANDVEYVIKENHNFFTEKTKTINLNSANNFYSTIYQEADTSNPNSLGYLPGNDLLKKYGNTLEGSFILPKKFSKDSPLYFTTSFLTSSLFGMHNSNNGTWNVSDNASYQVFCVKENNQSSNAKFVLSSSYFGEILETEIYKEVYNNEKWNIAVSLRNEKQGSYDITGSLSGSYILEFYGINTIQDIEQNYFLLTASVDKATAETFFAADKMIYAGAHRENFSGSTLQNTDVKIRNVKLWNTYVDKDTIKENSKDDSYGLGYDILYDGVKKSETLALHWNFETVTGSDSGLYPSGNPLDDDATFIVEDISSGSLQLLNYDSISPYTKYQFHGKGNFFARNSDNFLSIDYVQNTKRSLPEVINSDDLVNILERDDEIFTRQTIPVNHYFSIEKSMNQIVSHEMLKWLGTIQSYNDIIGKPIYRYQSDYKELDKLKQEFFRNVENEADFEKFLDLYKWVDEAIYVALLQLVPASLDMVQDVFNVFESHIFERKKYRHKLPTLEFKAKDPEAPTDNYFSRWYGGCHPLLERSQQQIEERNELSPIILSELKRRDKLVYTYFKVQPVSILSKQKQNPGLIIGVAGGDPFATTGTTFTNLIPAERCEEE